MQMKISSHNNIIAIVIKQNSTKQSSSHNKILAMATEQNSTVKRSNMHKRVNLCRRMHFCTTLRDPQALYRKTHPAGLGNIYGNRSRKLFNSNAADYICDRQNYPRVRVSTKARSRRNQTYLQQRTRVRPAYSTNLGPADNKQRELGIYSHQQHG
jgi:hypothetical protein